MVCGDDTHAPLDAPSIDLDVSEEGRAPLRRETRRAQGEGRKSQR